MKKKGYTNISGLEKATQAEIKQRNLEHYGSKIKLFRNRSGITAEKLAETLQISISSIRNWECGLTRPDPEYLYRMFSILDVEPNEFFGIEGVGTLLTQQERDLVDNFRQLDNRGRMDIESFTKMQCAASHSHSLYRAHKDMLSRVSLSRYASTGTSGTDWPDAPEREDFVLYRSPLLEMTDEIFTVSGESMEPKFHDHDKVLVEYTTEIEYGDIGIFYVPGIGGVIKQKAHDRLHSLNPEYDDIFPYEDGATLIGRVLGRLDDSMIPDPDSVSKFWEAEEELKRNPHVFDAYDGT